MRLPTLSQSVLAAMVTTVIMASCILLGLASYTDYTETLDRAENTAETVARLTEEHVLGIISASNASLLRLSDMIQTYSSLNELSGSLQAWRHIEDMSHSLPRIGHLWVFDPQGDAVLTSLQFPAPLTNVANHEYFAKAVKQHGLVINPAIKSRITGTHYFSLGRAIRDATGQPIALVVAAIEADYFTRLYASIGLDPRSAIAVFDTQGQVVLRYPPIRDQDIGRRFSDAAFVKMAETTPEGTYRMTSVIDQVDRIFAYRRLSAYPLIVLAAVSVEAALDDWRGRLLRNTVITALVAGALLAAAVFAYRLLRQEEATKTALLDAVAALEQNRQALSQAIVDKERERERADEANAAKSRFLAAASHDLRQPLQAVNLFVELLVNSTSGKTRDVAEKAREAMESGRALLDSLLDLSILEAGTQRMAPADFSLNDVIASLAAEFDAQFAERGVRFRVVPCSAVVHTDPVLLKRILRNLLVNALRYTPTGGVLLGCRPRGNRIRIEVWDTGPGIPKNRLDDIFKEYVRLDDHAMGPIKGLGLGLSIVAKTAKLLGAEVDVRSRLGKGSVFAIQVPRAEGGAVRRAG